MIEYMLFVVLRVSGIERIYMKKTALIVHVLLAVVLLWVVFVPGDI